jgi:hypothetical protein
MHILFSSAKKTKMQTLLKPLLAGAAALALTAASLPAHANDTRRHVIAVTLPDGQIARIAYTGNVPPQIVLAPAPAFPPLAASFAMPALPPAFAELEKVSEAMQHEADMMLRQAADLPTLTQAGTAGLPAGVRVYSTETTITGNGACTRRTEITYAGNGAAPRQISNISGDCSQTSQHLTAPHDQPRLIEATHNPITTNL